MKRSDIWAGCFAAIVSVGLVISASSALAQPAQSGFSKDDLQSLTKDGSKLLDVQTGDLTGNGNMGALVVIAPPSAGQESGGDPARTLLLVDRDAEGDLRTLASNKKLVPCAKCGGAMGDPYGYARVTPGHFIVVIEGGSRERWSDQYNFKYAPSSRTWVVESVVRGVGDVSTGKSRQLKLSSKKLGTTTLDDFDPDSLPQVTLP